MAGNYPFQKMTLPYAVDAMEPYLDADTLYIHYTEIYEQSVDALNYILNAYPQYQNWTLEQLMTQSMQLPVTLANSIQSFARSVYNHELYFDGMTANHSGRPVGELAQAIQMSFGSYEQFASLLRNVTYSMLDAGWIAVVAHGGGELHFVTLSCSKMLSFEYEVPVLMLDIWEHAYFLKYHSRRGEYVDAWLNLVDWEKANILYRNAAFLDSTL